MDAASRRGYLAAVMGSIPGLAAVGVAGYVLSIALAGGVCALDEITPSCHMGELWWHFLWTAGGGLAGLVLGCFLALRVCRHEGAGRTALILGVLVFVGAVPWIVLVLGIVSLSENLGPLAVILSGAAVLLAPALARRLNFLGPSAQQS